MFWTENLFLHIVCQASAQIINILSVVVQHCCPTVGGTGSGNLVNKVGKACLQYVVY